MKHVSLACICVLLAWAGLGCAADSGDLEAGNGGATATGGSSVGLGGRTGQLGSGGSAGAATGTGGSAGTTRGIGTGGSAGTTHAADAATSADSGSSVCRPRPPCPSGWFLYQDTVCSPPNLGSGPGCSTRGDGLCYQRCKTSSDCTDPRSPTCSGLTIFNGSDVGQTTYVCSSGTDLPACPATASGGSGGGGGIGPGGASGAGGVQAAGGRPGAGGAAGGGGTPVDGAVPVDADPTINLDGAVACSTSSANLACKTDSDCCLVFDQCYSHLALVAKADVESVTACYRTKETRWCTSCCPPVVDTWCQAGQCVAAAVSNGCGQPHCGRLAADAGPTVSMSASTARDTQPAVTVDAAVVTGTWFGCSGM